MQSYANRGGDSGIVGYESYENGIRVRFKDGKEYLYTERSAGVGIVQQMKLLALSGQGLHAFINRVQPGYAWRS